MPIEDLARDDVVTATPDTLVPALASLMEEEAVGSVVIVDGETPVGIVTDRDLAIRVLADGEHPGERTAEDVMTDDLATVEAGVGFYEAAELMADHGVRRLPVCEGDTLVGIVTADDLTELLADEHQQFASVVQAQRPAY
jgi:CBS domain-containing protein